MQQTGRPRKKAKITARTMTTPTTTSPFPGDGADSSAVSQLDLDREAEAVPQSVTQSRAQSPKGVTLEQKYDELLSPSSEIHVEGSGSYPFTCALDDYTRFLIFDDPLMDMPDMVNKHNCQRTEERSARESAEAVNTMGAFSESRASQPLKDQMLYQDAVGLLKSFKSAVSVPDMRTAQSDLVGWEGLDKDLSKPTPLADTGSSETYSCFPSPFPLDHSLPQLSTTNVHQAYQIQESEGAKGPVSPHIADQEEFSEFMSNFTHSAASPPLVDPRPIGEHSDMQALLQIQFELDACSAKLVSWEATPDQYNSSDPIGAIQSRTLGNLFSIVEKFISLISQPHRNCSENLSPENTLRCHSPCTPEIQNAAFGSIEHFASRTPSRIVQHAPCLNCKSLQSGLGNRVPDPAALHLVLAFHIRLMAAYEAIVGAIAAQSRISGKAQKALGAIPSLSIGGFVVECGTSLESHLHIQIVLHQLGRLGDACDAYFSRTHPPNLREDAIYVDSLRGSHERRRRAAPTTLRDMAKDMVEEQERALRMKIRDLSCGPHHVFDVDSFYYAEDVC
ncbi:MAG: hypothetical protein LQ338_002249 [Usnochroma carphineum]|nr:MAG: hypothetical protein LQ338_002249 [Usnochroma carphineum]